MVVEIASAGKNPSEASETPQSSTDLPQGKELATLMVPDAAPLTEVKNNGTRFSFNNGLIYFHDTDGTQRICIPKSVYKEVFYLAYDEHAHSGFHRTYERIAGLLYLRRLSDSLKQYIRHCPECQVNQTKRHPPYGALTPMPYSTTPFHTIAIDFVLALKPTAHIAGGFDCLLTITCKSTKRVLLVSGREKWGAKEWANVVITTLIGHDWGIPVAIISDRDPKFMSSFWRFVFEKLGTSLLTSTAYHPQTDGQSERTNQTVEIALRYLLTSHPDTDWTEFLPFLQGSLNNSTNATTGQAPNELAYGFKVRDSLNMLADLPIEDLCRLRSIRRKEAEEAVAFANAIAKARYDSTHKPISLREGSQVYLRLHRGYKIPGLDNRKLSHQRVGPFTIKKAVGPLAYELDLPPTMQIHPVISIAHLEPLPSGEDPFQRPRPDNPPPVSAEGDDAPEYEIERLLGKRISGRKL